jgi:LPS-assembly lipoprotein
MQNSRLHLTGLSSISIIVLIITLMLSSCGFQLRGKAELSFKNLHIQGSKLSISKDLKRSLDINGIKVVDNVESADMLLEMLGERNEKRILSLSGDGLVREFELNYSASFRTRAPADPLWSKVQTVQSRRDFSYNDNALLGKADEEARLNADMHNDAIREILRRLSAVKPAANAAVTQ